MSGGELGLRRIRQAKVAAASALAALEIELERTRVGKGAVSTEQELALIYRHLRSMADCLDTGNLPDSGNRPRGIGRVVTDSWPIESTLGELLIAAEKAYFNA
ncbi:hypothetical protein [Pilimelia columellifera]|uniref:Uncharacterized protein n=1 Tax=Pilimelia columellifera subsp. columellifera TaxID=706583 RepID=A0ABN3N5Z6_9ACTN